MIVVSDSTPLIMPMKANKLNILEGLFGEVLIPEAVYSEVTDNQAFRDEAELIRNSDYVRIVRAHDRARVSFLQRVTGLDLGESEAIIYADEVNADLLLMDEMAGRKIAMNMRLPMTGSVGVLIRVFQSGLITVEEAEDNFERIRKANRHISDRLIDDAMAIIRGRQ